MVILRHLVGREHYLTQLLKQVVSREGSFPVMRFMKLSDTERREQAQIEPCRSHELRRTFVTSLLEAGIDINTTRQLVDHTDIQATARYDLRDEKARKKASRR